MNEQVYRTGRDGTGDRWEVTGKSAFCSASVIHDPALFFAPGESDRNDCDRFADFVDALLEAGEVTFGDEFTAALDAARGKR